jgi:tight adherence protein B
MILSAVLLGLIAALPWAVNHLRAERARQRVAAQLRQSLQNIVHALRVGIGFMQALEYAAKEGDPPLADEWRRTLQSVRLGHALSEAMVDLETRVPLKEMKWFSAAVQITQSTGGSLAEVLDTLSTTLQEQHMLREKVRALTAQGKASGALLSLLPFLMMGALYLVAPDLAMPLFVTSTGQTVIAGVIVSVAIGALVIKKIVNVKVD